MQYNWHVLALSSTAADFEQKFEGIASRLRLTIEQVIKKMNS